MPSTESISYCCSRSLHLAPIGRTASQNWEKSVWLGMIKNFNILDFHIYLHKDSSRNSGTGTLFLRIVLVRIFREFFSEFLLGWLTKFLVSNPDQISRETSRWTIGVMMRGMLEEVPRNLFFISGKNTLKSNSGCKYKETPGETLTTVKRNNRRHYGDIRRETFAEKHLDKPGKLIGRNPGRTSVGVSQKIPEETVENHSRKTTKITNL